MTNTGNVTLTNVDITDTLPGIVLSGGPILSMAPGAVDSTTFSATYALTQPDIDAGNVQNQATVTGTPPSGPDVSDLSGTSNANDTPTDSAVTQTPGIMLEKTSDVTGLAAGVSPGDTFPYTFNVINTGNVTLNNITISDPLVGLVLSGGPIVSLAPGDNDNTTITGTYTVTAADILAGEVNNTATAAGVWGPSNTPIDDDDNDTAIVVAVVAVSEVYPVFTTDGGTTTTMLASDTVGGVQAKLANVDITVITSDPELTLDPTTGLITLAPGHPAGQYQVTYEICSTLYPLICDQAVETVTQGALPGIEAVKTQTLTDNGDGINGVGDTVTYTITVTNTGNMDLSGVGVVDTFEAMDGATLTLDSGPSFVSASSGSGEGDLVIGETATYSASFVLTIDAVTRGGVSNQVVASGTPVPVPGVTGPFTPVTDVSDDGDDLDGNTDDDPTELPIAPSLSPTGLTILKTTTSTTVLPGLIVPYTLTVTNQNPVVSGSLNIVDIMPEGFLYEPGSAMIDGNPYAVNVQGRVITFENVPVPPLTTVVAALSARVTAFARPGDKPNVASLRNPATGDLLAPPSTATVYLPPDPTFDCGDVIGQVFNDANGNGYPDGANQAISDNSFDGKLGSAPSAVDAAGLNQAEDGLPGVKVVAVDGTTVLTDDQGRFSIPCAALPAKGGSNYILKLDPRSLPSGYRLTTENPRVVRITPGKAATMNFGASLVSVVRVDLNGRGFGTGDQPQITPALDRSLDRMIDALSATTRPTAIRISYFLDPNSGKAEERRATRSIRLVEKYIEREWRSRGDGKLLLERNVVRARQ